MDSSKCDEPGSVQVWNGTESHFKSPFSSMQDANNFPWMVWGKDPVESPPNYNPAVKSKCCEEGKIGKCNRCSTWTDYMPCQSKKSESPKNRRWCFQSSHFIIVSSDTEQSLVKIQMKVRGLLASFSLNSTLALPLCGC